MANEKRSASLACLAVAISWAPGLVFAADPAGLVTRSHCRRGKAVRASAIILLLGVSLPIAPAQSQTIVYSQTSLAGSTGVMPGLFDELGVLGGDGSTRLDFYEIFTNNSGADVIVDTAVVFGGVNTASTAVIVGLTTGTLGTVSITFPNLTDVRASAAVPVSTSTSDPGCFASPTSGFTACPITIRFSPGVLMPAGTQLAFGFIVPETKVLDAFLWGTDTIDGGGVISSTTPPYWTGFYATDSAGTLFTAVGDHYLVIEASAPTIQQVLAFFDSSAAAGTLTGSGPGNSGEGRLRALRNMLESAANLIGSGDTADAILQLHDAYLRTDGLSPPPDFVTGPAAPELASLIQQLIASLGG